MMNVNAGAIASSGRIPSSSSSSESDETIEEISMSLIEDECDERTRHNELIVDDIF